MFRLSVCVRCTSRRTPVPDLVSNWPRDAEQVGAELQSLWDEWIAERETHVRNRLLLHYSPLVRFVVARIAAGMPAHIEFADLISTGVFGLIDALEKYHPERGVPFEAYAMTRIRGAVLDELRAQDWVPRSARERQRAVEQAGQQLQAELGRAATAEELAHVTGLTTEQVMGARQHHWFSVVESLDEVVSGGDDDVARTESIADVSAPDPESWLTQRESHEHLLAAVDQLPAREAQIIRLYYGDALSLREVGEVLGVTESRASQLRSRAIAHLRDSLGKDRQRAA